ncbi:MAG: ABC-type transport auxiliary lipoprotein family protein [Thermodesulfobacteriota bacterium]
MKAMTAPMPATCRFRQPRLSRLTIRPRILLLLVAALILLPLGCGKPPMLVNQYMLDYPAPVVAAKTKNPETIKVGLFSVAQAFNTNAMVYQPQPYKSATYNYSRWRANPGYLVTDYLLRDFRDSRLFSAVFGPNSTGKYRFFLEGGVEEFQELDEPDGWKAALAVNVTLLDVSAEELPQRVVFQKNYRAVEPMPEKTPQGLAQGMSRAMERLSASIITDTYEAARRRAARK